MPQYQAPQIDASSGFDSNRANEFERRGWTKESYDHKNLEPVNYYDFTRKHLNFEIKRGEPLKDESGKVKRNKKGNIIYGKPSIIPLGTQDISLKKRYEKRLEEIGHKAWENAKGNQPNTNVSIVLNGDHDRMCEIAYGKSMDFQIGEDNSGVQLLTLEQDQLADIARQYGVEDLVDESCSYSQISIYALCYYKFLCDKFGEENVIGLACHLDETTPHFHSLVIPVAEKKKQGRSGGYTEVDENGNPVLDEKGKEIHITTRDYERMPQEKRTNYITTTRKNVLGVSYAHYFGESIGEGSRSYEKWHDMIHEEVTKQWGFDRGERLRDMTPEGRKNHRRKSKKQLERERIAEEKRQKEEAEKAKEAKKRTEEQEEKEQDAKRRAKEATEIATAQEEKVKRNELTLRSQDGMIKYKADRVREQNEMLRHAQANTEVAKQEEATAKEKTRKAIEQKEEAENSVLEAQKKKDSIDKETEVATTKLATAKTELEKWEAIVFDEKSILYPSLTEMKTSDGRTFKELLDGKVQELVDSINKPIGRFESHKSWKTDRLKEAKTIVTELEDALFGDDGIDTAHKKAILHLGKSLYSEAKSMIAQTYKENQQLKKDNQDLKAKNQTLQSKYDTLKVENEKLTRDLDVEKTANSLLSTKLKEEKFAYFKNGKPVMWTGNYKKGQQVTKTERIEYLEEQFEAKKKELEAEKVTRAQEQEKNKNEWIAHKRHMREVKEMISAVFSLNFKKVIRIIIDHWKAEAKEFARDVMNELKTYIFGAETTMKGRKEYVSDAFVWAKVFAEFEMDDNWKPDKSKLQPLEEDAMRIADGTWESYHGNQKLKDAAVEAIVRMANEPGGSKWWNDDDIKAVDDYLHAVDDRRKGIQDLQELAAPNVEHVSWLDNLVTKLNNGALSNSQGWGY